MSKYYIKRNISTNYDNYWGVVKDPDGKVKDLLSKEEADKHIRNTKEEIEFVNNLKGGTVLEIGFGRGHFLHSIKGNWIKVGVDPYGKYLYNDDTLISYKNLEDINFIDGCFDIIILYHVIEHIEKPEELIQEIYRILKINGKLLIATPDFDSWCARRFGSNFRMLHDKTHISLFSKKSMIKFLTDYGFYIDKIKFPFFKTSYFTLNSLLRLFNKNRISPPCYGSFMAFYCTKKGEANGIS